MSAEQKRLADPAWKNWGPYLSERQWGTVREDYSADGNAWAFFPHEHARSRAYRWGEDGIAGICDEKQLLCFALGLWNGKDSILKERLFGLTGHEGNHGEDVKEHYYYLDATPTSSYLKYLYKYPQCAFPYEALVHENAAHGKKEREVELQDLGVFKEKRYFDVFVEYAKEDAETMAAKITIANRGPETSRIHLVPSLWFRNTWSWKPGSAKPRLWSSRRGALHIDDPRIPQRFFYVESAPASEAEFLFCENETNSQKLFGLPGCAHPKDAVNDYVVNGRHGAVNPEGEGTKAGIHYRFDIPAGKEVVVHFKLCVNEEKNPFSKIPELFIRRKKEADEFYAGLQKDLATDDEKLIQRQAFAGLLWGKQFYSYDVREWLHGDAGQTPPPAGRQAGRNRDWIHVHHEDIISMPDKWEYPWFAAWDLAFHTLAFALVDPAFAKEQLLLLTRERYMHPNGQLPAYEWAFGDVNPPVHAWAVWRVYQIERK
ncbi:MAG: glucosidase, partial [Spirochaetia bacterium]|nr:glucosidase [Spirochaetia bacterium]